MQAPGRVPSLLGNRYRLLTPLGAGGMGAVYRAYDQLTGKEVALKQVVTTLAQPFADPALRLALAHEFRALAGLHHPHIIAVRDYGFDAQQQPYFTMELLVRSRTIVETGQFLAQAEQINLLLQMLYALAYLHRREVVHRDLKPGNVLVQGKTVKVLDFGLATTVGQITPPTGTLSYAAPEVLHGEAATSAADLFATGIIAYELLAGWHPFGTTPHTAVQAILHSEPDWSLLNLEPPLVQVLQRLLAKAPADRYPDAQAVITALAIATGQPLALETQATRESFLQAAPLIGRQTELQQLTTALNQATTGQGSFWLIRGESGVGKSRLLSEIRTQALVQGAQVLHGQASSAGRGAYHLWRDPLRWLVLLTQPPDHEAAILKPLVPGIEQLLERPVTDAPLLEAKAAQTRLLATLITLLERASAQQPLLLLLEDVHWADENSLELLQWLQDQVTASEGSPLRLLALVSYRWGEAPHLHSQLSNAQVLTLARFSAAEMERLSVAMLGAGGQNAQLRHFLQRETEGNAFFVVEVLRTLAEEAGQLANVSAMTLPSQIMAGGIQQVIQRRLQRVPAEQQPLLALAAVAGRRLDLTLLRALFPTLDLDEWLVRCANALILESQEGRWHFQHDKLRESLLTSLAAEQRQDLHRQVGRTLAQIYQAQLAPHYAELAYHFGQAQEKASERHYLRLAGETAQASFANATAIAHYTRLLALVEGGERVEVLLQLGAVLKLVGRWPEAEEHFQQARQLAIAQDDHLALARALQALGNLQRGRSDFAGALAWLTQARVLLVENSDLSLLCALLIEMGNVNYQQGEYAAARQQLEEALPLARALQDRQQTAQALHTLGNVVFDQGDYSMTQTLYQESLGIRREIRDQVGIASTLNNLGILAMYQADFVTSQQLYEESLTIRRAIGDLQNTAVSLSNLGIVAKEQGDYPRALALYEEALTIHQGLGNVQGMAYARNNIASVLTAQGHLAQAQTLYLETLVQRRGIGDKWGIASTLSSLGDIAVAQADFVTAHAYYRESLQLLQTIRDTQKIAYGLVGMATVLGKIDNAARSPERAVQLVAAAHTLLEQNGLRMESSAQHFYDEIVADLRALLPEATFALQWATGTQMDVTAALAAALNL